jgi:hypothetical protein
MSAPPGCPTTDLDPWSDSALDDPYPVYEAMREVGPVMWLDRYKIAALPRFADVRQALTDWRTFTSAKGAGIDHEQAVAMGESILTSDPPVHSGYRKPLTDLLSVASLSPEVQVIEAVANDFADRLVRACTFDVVKDLSAPYSVKVVMDLLGLPDESRDLIAPLGERAFNTMGPADERLADGAIALDELRRVTYAGVGQLCPGGHGERLMRGAAVAHPGADVRPCYHPARDHRRRRPTCRRSSRRDVCLGQPRRAPLCGPQPVRRHPQPARPPSVRTRHPPLRGYASRPYRGTFAVRFTGSQGRPLRVHPRAGVEAEQHPPRTRISTGTNRPG